VHLWSLRFPFCGCGQRQNRRHRACRFIHLPGIHLRAEGRKQFHHTVDAIKVLSCQPVSFPCQIHFTVRFLCDQALHQKAFQHPCNRRPADPQRFRYFRRVDSLFLLTDAIDFQKIFETCLTDAQANPSSASAQFLRMVVFHVLFIKTAFTFLTAVSVIFAGFAQTVVQNMANTHNEQVENSAEKNNR